jgi:hypothetical protein
MCADDVTCLGLEREQHLVDVDVFAADRCQFAGAGDAVFFVEVFVVASISALIMGFAATTDSTGPTQPIPARQCSI